MDNEPNREYKKLKTDLRLLMNLKYKPQYKMTPKHKKLKVLHQNDPEPWY